MKFYIIAGLIIFVTSCITKNDKKEVTQSDSTPVLVEKAEIAPPNAVDSSQKLLNFIAEFVEKDFLRAHKELVDQGKEHNYQFTEIQHLGDMIKYSFEIPDVEGYQEYSCMPSQGETTTLVSGDHDVAKLYFDELELSKKWDRNDQTSNGRVLELHENWKDYRDNEEWDEWSGRVASDGLILSMNSHFFSHGHMKLVDITRFKDAHFKFFAR